MTDQINIINKLVAAGNIKAAKELIGQYLKDDNPIDRHLTDVIRTIHLIEHSLFSGGGKPSPSDRLKPEDPYDLDALDSEDYEYIEYNDSDRLEGKHRVLSDEKDDVVSAIAGNCIENAIEELDKDVSYYPSDELKVLSDRLKEEYGLPISTEIDGGEGAKVFIGTNLNSIDEDFDWGSIDDYDSIFNDNIFTPIDEPDLFEKYTISNHERTVQIAIEVITKFDWERDSLDLLSSIFCEYGWAATRKSIEFEMSRGLSKDELSRAYFMRHLWAENQNYWTNFFYISSNIPGQTASASFSLLGWREAIRVVRSFTALPSEEEIESLIEMIYDDWYSSSINRAFYKAFIFYFKYRTGSIRHTLPPQELFTFSSSDNEDFPSCDHENYSGYINSIELLRDQGIDVCDIKIDWSHMGYKASYI